MKRYCKFICGFLIGLILIGLGYFIVHKVNEKPVVSSIPYKYMETLRKHEIPPMTPQIIAVFEEQAKKIPLAEKNEEKHRRGVWMLAVPLMDNSHERKYRFVGDLDRHRETKFVTETGKEYIETHLCYIDIVTNAHNHQVKRVSVMKIHVSKETGPFGIRENIYYKEY